MNLQQQNEIYQNLNIQVEQTSTQIDQVDVTPMFGIDVQNIKDKNIEINNCINGITEAILIDNIFLKQFSFCKSNYSNLLFARLLQAREFQRNIFSLDFSFMIKQDRLQQYYRKSNLIQQQQLMPNSQIKLQQNSEKLQSIKVSISYSDAESIYESSKKKSLKKYKSIESQYSPKNLKTYLKTQLHKKGDNQQRFRSQSTHNASQISQSSMILKKQPNIQMLQRNNFCLISTKHKELSKAANLNQNYQLSQKISIYNQSAKFN